MTGEPFSFEPYPSPGPTAPPVVATPVVATPVSVAEPQDAPEPPKDVTRTRGGASSRAVRSASEPEDTGAVELHVPVKKRGGKR